MSESDKKKQPSWFKRLLIGGFLGGLFPKNVESKDHEFNLEEDVKNLGVEIFKYNKNGEITEGGEQFVDSRQLKGPEAAYVNVFGEHKIGFLENKNSKVELKDKRSAEHETVHVIQNMESYADNEALMECFDDYESKIIDLIKKDHSFIEDLPRGYVPLETYQKEKRTDLSQINGIKEVKDEDGFHYFIDYSKFRENYGEEQLKNKVLINFVIPNNIVNKINYNYKGRGKEEVSQEMEAHIVQYLGAKNAEKICGSEIPTARYFKEKNKKLELGNKKPRRRPKNIKDTKGKSTDL